MSYNLSCSTSKFFFLKSNFWALTNNIVIYEKDQVCNGKFKFILSRQLFCFTFQKVVLSEKLVGQIPLVLGGITTQEIDLYFYK